MSKKPIQLMLYSFSILFLLSGVTLTFLSMVFLGLLLIVLGIYLSMPMFWFNQYLKRLPISKYTRLDSILEWRVLAMLGKDKEVTVFDIWQAVRDHNHAHFFAVRYGIHQSFLDQVLPTAQIDVQQVWHRAMLYREKNKQNHLNAASIFVAILYYAPGRDELLNALHLDIGEVEDGIGWVGYIKKTVWEYRNNKGAGGIARDWTAGYTPLLNELGRNISYEAAAGILHRPVPEHALILEQMVKVLSQTGRSNIALVGEIGTGKTAIVSALAELMIQGKSEELKFQQVFALNAATILSSARGRGEVEQMIHQMVFEASHAKNIILFFDEAQLFLEDGTGSVDITNVLMPILDRSSVRFIFALSPQYWQRLTRQNSAFAGLVNYQLVNPPSERSTYQIMEDQTLLIESRHKVAVSYFALREAYHLADHYISEEAFPGKAIKLIEQAAVSAGPKTLITAEHVQQSIETSRGVKVQSVTQDESAKLLNLEDEIHQQMINQYRAVKVVSSALRRARAGVRDRNRPIGTFMFLGPTGVGKTQLAKALADVYFGGKDQIVRLDMNEYVNDTDVPRLLAAERENSTGVTFLNQIRQQPFSVVLLDEIEKAHPNVVNIFLQLLDEGTINDTDGRPASFKDAIIIATSNAGAERIRQYLDAGYEVEQFEDQFSNELIEMGIFKPEFLNRFDELVVFRSLKPAELMKVVTLMVNDVNKAIGSQKIKVELDDAAKMWLVERGNDPRLGARPMRRMVQRYVEDIIASKMLSGEAQSGAVITLTVQNFEEVAA
ncbi:ATP-dependent Clp protease ATP-binding subunit [Candidatus Saccharibacteria bacterium]|nr:ATP-dependent Clp protease ATP-binding subunit [Candidatus Saccharibacteria bacterium]